jgi:RNA polymerase sigma-70 factor, ECF subfamily
LEKSEAIGYADRPQSRAAAPKPEEKLRLAALYSDLKRPVYLLALSILRDGGLAEDVMQQTFLQAMEHAGSFRLGTNKKAWVMTIAHNLAVNCLKRRAREGLNLDDYLIKERGEERDLDGAEDYLAAMAILDGTERTVVTLKAVCCLRHKQIAKIAGISVPDCRAKYSRALKKLKRHYLENGYCEE